MTARVTYGFNVSLDGYINDRDGSLDWFAIDEEIHQWWNDRARQASTFVYGRRLYESMAAYWPFALDDPNVAPVEQEFARIWQPMPKLVFSSTLESVGSNSELVRGDAVAEIARLKREGGGSFEVGGATLAGDLIRAGLVDEYSLVICPVVLGEGTPFFPRMDHDLPLKLVESHKFGSGALLLRYIAD
jgi:dihydrofolate reductase